MQSKKVKKNLNDVPGFSVKNEVNYCLKDTKHKKRKAKSGGGFQCMGLSRDVLNGIIKKGYKIPTPIQRKVIPLILQGRDVVAMARTGSGKTAGFLIPLFEKLKMKDNMKGPRALILSPTRELAIQTYRFIKELGKYLNLKTATILGGDPMESQFAAVHMSPDIIVATPGRFLHICVEMDLKLTSIEYVVFDEADRLFEMGFGEQLNETLCRLPATKQMVMFSATLPKQLIDFAKADLTDPILIRLDVEIKLPETLTLKFLYCRTNERLSVLVALLKFNIPSDAQTVIFAATQYHVELISHILNKSNISNTCIYSSLDPAARKINTAKFFHKKVSVLVVTDVAARGIDIPSLNYVINFHFPGKPKLFMHRVGRCARAGRSGTAFTIFAHEDQAHLLDLHSFLNRKIDLNDNSLVGVIPANILEEEHMAVMNLLKELTAVHKMSENAYKKYINTRPLASIESNKKAKLFKFSECKVLEDFYDNVDGYNKKSSDIQVDEFITRIRNFKSSGNIFELNCSKTSKPYSIMKEKRIKDSECIKRFIAKKMEMKSENIFCDDKIESDMKRKSNIFSEQSEKKKIKNMKDEKNFIEFQPSDKHTEEGLSINSFENQTNQAEFSIFNNIKETKSKIGMKKWDRIKKKMVSVEDHRSNKIKTESGIWIPSSFKTGRYIEWKEKSKIEDQMKMKDSAENTFNEFPIHRFERYNAKVKAKKQAAENSLYEMKNRDQIVKERIRKEIAKNREKINKKKKDERKEKHKRKKVNKK